MNNPQIPSDSDHRVLNKQINWKDLYFYQKGDAIFQMTFVFCERFLPKYGDRTVDQMVQAARSGKQNIVEGLADGITSTEMQLKLLNVGRASIQELQKDYEDFLNTRKLSTWDSHHSRYDTLLTFCRTHNKPEEYRPYFEVWTAEEMCNVGITVCHMIDKMMMNYLEKLEHDFVTKGGIKERMYAARTGYRQAEEQELTRLRKRVPELEQEVARLQGILRQNGIDF